MPVSCTSSPARCCSSSAHSLRRAASSSPKGVVSRRQLGLLHRPRRNPTTVSSQPPPSLSLTRRWESTAAAAPAVSTDPKITSIVDQISRLTLLETADLVSSLKTRLNIPDTPLAFSAGGASPGAAAAGGAPAAAAAEEEDDAAAAAPAEKTLFTLTLKSIDAGSKPKIIKEVKSMLGLSLVDSKKFVESAPKVMREGVPKEEGEKIVELLKGIGGVVTMD